MIKIANLPSNAIRGLVGGTCNLIGLEVDLFSGGEGNSDKTSGESVVLLVGQGIICNSVLSFVDDDDGDN